MNKLLNLCAKDWWFWVGLLLAFASSVHSSVVKEWYMLVPVTIGYAMIFSHLYAYIMKYRDHLDIIVNERLKPLEEKQNETE